VLRDAYGVIQTFVPTKLAASLIELHLESCLCVEGIVQDRGKDRSKNKQMVTGDIEVLSHWKYNKRHHFFQIYAETIGNLAHNYHNKRHFVFEKDVLNYAKENLPLFDTSNQITRWVINIVYK
jgi:aspartyl-tRNA synthetase